MRPFPWKCEECGERAVHDHVLDEYTTSMDHDGRSYDVSVENLEAAKCRNCGAVVLHRVALRRLSDALRSVVGILAPGEIRANRESLKLTQKELAAFLHIAEATLSRWETGTQIQQRCMDRLLRGFFEVPEFRRFVSERERAVDGAVLLGTGIRNGA